jgi:hypothetical protein
MGVPASADRPSSPLAAYPGFGHNWQEDEAQFEGEEHKREQFLVQCMKEEGFEYLEAPSVSLDDVSLEEFVNYEDPNEVYVASLTPADRERYFVALTGVPNPESENLADQPDLKTYVGDTGCLGEARAAIPGVFAARSALMDEYEEMKRAVLSDAGIVAAFAQWAECMDQRGYPGLSSPSDIYRSVDDAALEGTAESSQALLAGAQQELATSQSCDSEVGLSKTLLDVTYRYEENFVKTYSHVLDAHLAATGVVEQG